MGCGSSSRHGPSRSSSNQRRARQEAEPQTRRDQGSGGQVVPDARLPVSPGSWRPTKPSGWKSRALLKMNSIATRVDTYGG